MQLRRIVAGYDESGRAVVASDGPPPRQHDFVHVPGLSQALVWATDSTSPPLDGTDPTPAAASFLPGPGGTRLIVGRIPPESSLAGEDFDPVAAGAETAEHLPGLADTLDPDNPGFHTTPTVDYTVVLEGEVWLALSDGSETLARRGDIVIQNATPHAWHNRSDAPAMILGVLVGVER
jgi:hypothetical protein